MSAWILHSVLRPPWRMTGVGGERTGFSARILLSLAGSVFP